VPIAIRGKSASGSRRLIFPEHRPRWPRTTT
jgi:hypothetical protein